MPAVIRGTGKKEKGEPGPHLSLSFFLVLLFFFFFFPPLHAGHNGEKRKKRRKTGPEIRSFSPPFSLYKVFLFPFPYRSDEWG